MPVAKHLSYATLRSRTGRPRRSDAPSFAHFHIRHDEASRVRAQRASAQWPAIAVAAVACRSLFRTVAQFAGTAGDILPAIASWMLTEMLNGCAAYALAMHGIPVAADDDEAGDPKPSNTPSEPQGHPPRAALLPIPAARERDIRVAEILSPADAAQPCAISRYAARSEQMSGPRSGWRTAITAPAAGLLSKIREGYARQRAIAELTNLDERSLSDIGISRADIGYIARYGARPER